MICQLESSLRSSWPLMNHCCPAVLHICCDAFETCTLGEISCQKHPKQEIRKFVWDSYFVGIKLINGTTELAEVLRSCGYVEPFLSLSLVSSDHVTQCNVLLAQEQQCRCSLRIWPDFPIHRSVKPARKIRDFGEMEVFRANIVVKNPTCCIPRVWVVSKPPPEPTKRQIQGTALGHLKKHPPHPRLVTQNHSKSQQPVICHKNHNKTAA